MWGGNQNSSSSFDGSSGFDFGGGAASSFSAQPWGQQSSAPVVETVSPRVVEPAHTSAVRPMTAAWSLSVIRSTPVSEILGKTAELLRQGQSSQEYVVGMAQCLMAWKQRVDITALMKVMGDIYCQRLVTPPSKLAIFYVFNDCVQKDPQTFAPAGYRYFVSVIPPHVSLLPPPINESHRRVLEIWKERSIYSSDLVATLRRLFQLKRDPLAGLLELDVTASVTNENAEALRGKVEATLQATVACSKDRRICDTTVSWANELLQAVGLSKDSVDEEFRTAIDDDSYNSIVSNIKKAMKFIAYELELLQYLALDWSICLGENRIRVEKIEKILKSKINPASLK